MNLEIKAVVFLGPPGSGKGTQSSWLARDMNFHLVGMGELVRREIASESFLGQKIKSEVAAGRYPESQEVIGLLSRFLYSGLRDQKTVLLDGVPRYLEQVFHLKEQVPFLDIVKVIFLDVPEDCLLERIKNRWQCNSCGKPALNHEQSCSFCGHGEYSRRSDDKPDIFLERLKVYKNSIEPLLDFYESRNLLVRLDGRGSVHQLQAQIKSEISKIL
ncbi:MAG: hypothetical protein BGO07_04675 [Alphaproteobacteria bacterium 40-19]|nr:MAG: hypothetical protein BGO07_04675 [Alphaproteobacteria bacterium 40-19]